MRVTHNDHYLITAGYDGTIIIYQIKDKEALGQKMSTKEPFDTFADEVLVTKEEMT